jgi:prevent-host-death family protein
MVSAQREPAMTTVGVKELKDHLSEYLRRVAKGERVIVTERGRPVASLSPMAEVPSERVARRLVEEGLANWRGGKPRGSARPPTPRQGTIADAVLDDRK